MKKIILTLVIILCLLGCSRNTSTNISEISMSKSESSELDKEFKLALSKVQIYSKHMYMSRDAIFRQLTSKHGDAFPNDVAEYVLENINIDYKENALKKANSYKKDKNMKKEDIKEILLSNHGDRFTIEETKYALDNLE